jgi:hypothetical protein
MRRAVLVAMCGAAIGCGEDPDIGESGACASGIVLNGDAYVGIHIAGPDRA